MNNQTNNNASFENNQEMNVPPAILDPETIISASEKLPAVATENTMHFAPAATRNASAMTPVEAQEFVVNNLQKDINSSSDVSVKLQLYKMLENAMKTLNLLRNPVPNEANTLKAKTEIRKAVSLATTAFGKFRFNGDELQARNFWDKFKAFIESQDYDDIEIKTYAVPILRQLITAPNASAWFSENVTNYFAADNPVTMAALEEKFLEGWINPIIKSMDEARLHTFSWGNESAITFVNREN